MAPDRSEGYDPLPTHEAEEVDPLYPPRKMAVTAWSLGSRRQRTLIRSLLIFAFIAPLITYIFLGHGPLTRHPALFPKTISDSKSVLLVVAHPDDECLFFSPSVTTILNRASAKPRGHILVLSSGDHYGLGAQRREELKGSCRALGVTDDYCEVLNLADIHDDPNFWWPTDRLVEIVKPYVDRWSIDLVVTFDSGGISGHINHRAVSAAMLQAAQSNSKFPPVYASKTVFLLRKYSGLIDLPISFTTYLPRFFQSSPSEDRALLVGSWPMYLAARRAFKSHASQLVWDRWLYMVVSRYMYFNELIRVG